MLVPTFLSLIVCPVELPFAFCAPNCGLLTIVDTCVSLRGAMLNLKDWQYPTISREEITRLINPTLSSLPNSGVLVPYVCLVGKIFLFGYMFFPFPVGEVSSVV